MAHGPKYSGSFLAFFFVNPAQPKILGHRAGPMGGTKLTPLVKATTCSLIIVAGEFFITIKTKLIFFPKKDIHSFKFR